MRGPGECVAVASTNLDAADSATSICWPRCWVVTATRLGGVARLIDRVVRIGRLGEQFFGLVLRGEEGGSTCGCQSARARDSFGNAPGECTSGAAPAASTVATVEAAAATAARPPTAPQSARRKEERRNPCVMPLLSTLSTKTTVMQRTSFRSHCPWCNRSDTQSRASSNGSP